MRFILNVPARLSTGSSSSKRIPACVDPFCVLFERLKYELSGSQQQGWDFARGARVADKFHATVDRLLDMLGEKDKELAKVELELAVKNAEIKARKEVVAQFVTWY